MARASLWLAGVLALAAAGCGEPAAAVRLDLERALSATDRVAIVADPACRAAAARAAAGERLDALVVAEPGAPIPSDAARVVLGGTELPPARALALTLGVELLADGFRFAGRVYGDPGDALVATFADPERPALPVTLWLANDAALLARYPLDVRPIARPGFRVFRSGELEREGELDLDGTLWPGELERDREDALLARDAARVRRAAGGALFDSPAELDPARADAYAEEVERALARARAWTFDGAPPAAHPAPRVVLYADPADKLRGFGDAQPGSLNPVEPAAHALVAPGLPTDGGAAAASADAIAALGPPAHAWMLDGAGTWAADSWWGRPLGEWRAHLVRGGLLPGFAHVVAPDAGRSLSPHVLGPARALLFELALETYGAARMRAWWRGEEQRDLDELSAAFAILARRADPRPSDQPSRAARVEAALAEPLGRGIVLTRPPGRVAALESGYSTELASRALAHAARLGARAVALPVYRYVEPLPRRYAAPLGPPSLSASDGDGELAAALARARELGLGTMLQPHLLSSASGSWAGQRPELVLPEHWTAFFGALREHVVHFALLAELCDVDVLCLATSIPAAAGTGEVPDEAPLAREGQLFKLDRWTHVTERAAAAFSGPLTYGATWGGRSSRVARVELWDRLDLVGAELFATAWDPERADGAPSVEAFRADLARELRALALLGRRTGRPVLITGFGFGSTERAWDRGWLPRGERDARVQADLYRAFGEALDEVEGIHGAFLWSWSTDPSAAARDRGFTPQGKPAQAELRALFER